jgi:hypothetical protein
LGEGVTHLGEAPGKGEVEPVLGDLELALDGAALHEQFDGRQGEGPPHGAPVVANPVLPDLTLRHAPLDSVEVARKKKPTAVPG